MRGGFGVIFGLFLAGCVQDDISDLKLYMDQVGHDSQEKMEPLPEVKVPEVFRYDASGLPDPFSPRNLSPVGSGPAPDLSRPKTHLETFPLDGLRMVGILKRGSEVIALVRTPDNTIYPVRKGDRIGQNFGIVIGISDTAIKIRETVQDGVGNWTQNVTSLTLEE